MLPVCQDNLVTWIAIFYDRSYTRCVYKVLPTIICEREEEEKRRRKRRRGRREVVEDDEKSLVYL